MKKEKWIREIEEAKKKLKEYRVPDTYHICSMPYSFMESIMAKLEGSIPISWLKEWEEKHKNDPCYCGFVSEEIIKDWEKENDQMVD